MIQRFASLCVDLERAATDAVAHSLMTNYCSSVSDADAQTATALIHGRLTHRIISPRQLLQAVVHVTNTPAWLVELSRSRTGTLVDTAALLLPATSVFAEETSDDFEALAAINKTALVDVLLSATMEERLVLARLAAGLRPTRYSFTPQGSAPSATSIHSMITTVLYVHQEGTFGSARYSHITVASLRNDVLVPMARVANTLTREENQQLERAVASKSVERFGPTTMLASGITVEIQYADIVPSNRTKSGVRLVDASIVRIIEIT